MKPRITTKQMPIKNDQHQLRSSIIADSHHRLNDNPSDTYMAFAPSFLIKTNTHQQSSRSGKVFLNFVTIFFSAAALVGCASFQSIPPETPVATVLEKFGRPSTTCTRPDGTQRLIWTTQPFGQFAWGTNTTPQGNIVGFQQLLTDAHFQVLSTGKWTAKDVECEFGAPANKDGIAKGEEIVWGYRYKQYEVWPGMMYVYLGADGNLVNRYHTAPDPVTLIGR